MPYVQRASSGEVDGVFANFQPGYAEELLDEESVEIVAQLERGSIGASAIVVDKVDEQVQLARCQRYFELVDGTSTSTRLIYTHYAYKVTKRVPAVITLYSGTLSGADFDANTVSSLRSPAVTAASGSTAWVLAAAARLMA
jgi:hypothetical protein